MDVTIKKSKSYFDSNINSDMTLVCYTLVYIVCQLRSLTDKDFYSQQTGH